MALKFNIEPESTGEHFDSTLKQRYRAYRKDEYRARKLDQGASKLGLRPHKSLDQVNALDYFTNPAARMGWGTESLTEATQYELVRLSYDYWLMITLYTNHWLCRKIVDIPASDMIRAWPRLTSDIDPDDISIIDKAIRKTNTKANLLTAMKWGRLFGGAGALIVIDGQEHMLDQPLDLDSIELGAYKGVIPFDRWAGIQPSSNVSTNIKDPTRFNLPEYYEVQNPTGGSFKVHASRVLRFTGPTVPTPEYEARQEWGVSVIEVCFEEIRKRDNMSWNLLCLSYRANLISMQVPELAQMLSGASMNQASLLQFQGRMQQINAFMNSNNLMLLPKDGAMGSVSYSPSGWAELYQQFQMDIAGAVGIPVVKLFGRTATGLAQTNDADMQLYYDMIGQIQDTELRPQLDMLFPVICMSTLGQVPKDLDLIFPSARVMGEDEKANLAKSIGDLILGAAAGGIITRSMALRELKQSSDITGIFTNITDEDIAKAEQDEQAGLGGLGEEQGIPGGMPGQETGPPQEAQGGNPEQGNKGGLLPSQEEKAKAKEAETKQKEHENKLALEQTKGNNTVQKLAAEKDKAITEHSHKKEMMTLEQQHAEHQAQLAEKAEQLKEKSGVREWASKLLNRVRGLDGVNEDTPTGRLFSRYAHGDLEIFVKSRRQQGFSEHELVLSIKDQIPDSRVEDILRDIRKIPDVRVSKDSAGIKYISFAGIGLGIEYDAGERRLLKNDVGEVVYDKVLEYPYGFIQATMGRDQDELDVILGKDEDAKDVYLVWMVDLGPDVDQREDEHKVCLGFKTKSEAEKAFCSMYPKDWMGEVTIMSLEEFKNEIRTGIF